jgi:hypothetical protein
LVIAQVLFQWQPGINAWALIGGRAKVSRRTAIRPGRKKGGPAVRDWRGEVGVDAVRQEWPIVRVRVRGFAHVCAVKQLADDERPRTIRIAFLPSCRATLFRPGRLQGRCRSRLGLARAALTSSASTGSEAFARYLARYYARRQAR